MTITLNGTTGITTPAVTNNGAYTGDGISFADATPSNTLVTTTSGNVGVGTSSPLGKLTVKGLSGYNLTFGAVGTDARIDATNDAGSGSVDFVLSGNSLKFNAAGSERMRIDSSGNLLFNSGYGSVATAYGCRAWASFNGGTSTILASGNISSITQSSAGYYTVIFATAMVDANYATFPQFQPTASNAGSDSFAISPLTTQVDIRHFEANTARSGGYCCVSIFR